MRHSAVVLVFLALATVVARPAVADEASAKTEAHVHYQAGLELVRDGDFVGALEAFEKAYAASPHYAVLFNLGQTHAALGHSVEAVRAFERFLDEGGDHITPDRRREVEGIISRERARIAQVRLQIAPAGAEVFIDGHRAGFAPLGAQELSAGEHLVVAELAGYVPLVQALTVAAGETRDVVLTLALQSSPRLAEGEQRVASTPVPVRPNECVRAAPATPSPARSRKVAIGVGVGGVLLAGAAAATAAWNSARYAAWHRDQQRFDQALAGGNPGFGAAAESERLAREAAKVQRTDDIALGLALAAGSALITAGVLWVTSPRAER